MFFPVLALAAGLLSLGADARPIPHTVRLYRRAEIGRRAVIDYDAVSQTKAPKEWALHHNEPYRSYHFRYLQIGCHHMHDTDFFSRCCSPRISYQTDADYPYECSVAAHVTGVSEKKVQKQLKAANAVESDARHLEIVSISSASIASKESIKSVHSASKASKASASSASVAAIESSKEAAKASKSSKKAEASASKESVQASKSSVKAEATEEKPTPKPTPKPEPTPTTQQEAAPETTKKVEEQPEEPEEPEEEPEDDGNTGGGNGGGGGEMFGADFGTPSVATWFLQAGTIGACGLQDHVVDDGEKLAALRYDFYDASKCGQMLEVTNPANGKSVRAMFNDMCMGCQTATSVDLSPGAFEEIADFEAGLIDITWRWVDA